ncbi:PTS system N-acetylglucosamine-specific IIC component, Glc family [Streptosporangium subroseum]|uniref:PTS system N-acetylglucosamine-specific IIC component, Glc family n=1 Tax=Streptosporangium subroseum TaxID=106412 RepID=A0A239NPV0_9ACTN|nr:PTS transporter subunit EIIC [Streptosporangium subroseum]SNT56917.1 PTS system N-acetylglucosamine-specific IIC component, Glc family [Streptosporangium subroseum]
MSPPSADAGLPAASPPGFAVMSVLQRLGRSLMLPIAVLPAAGLLLRLGQDDLVGRTDNALLDNVAHVLGTAGGTLFDNLPILFAIGVAIGFARKADGSTALAALAGYLVFHAVSMTMFFNLFDDKLKKSITTEVFNAAHPGVPDVVLNLGAQNPTRVLGGIVMGLVSAMLWQRFYRTKLPTWLAFFSGRRLVPILTAFTGLVLGVIFGFIWPIIGGWLRAFGTWLAENSVVGAGIYGMVNRALLPLGLHHIVNNVIWTQVPECVVDGKQLAGDLVCFNHGAMGYGGFEAGLYPVLMFGLPAAAIAIWRAAPPHRRTAVGSIMISAALTAFLTGITEPIEFAFIFVAPMLFVVHIVLTGISLAIASALGAKLAFSFSSGLIDLVLYGTAPNAQGVPIIIVMGLIYSVIYYAGFSFLIRKLNIMTPGREPEPDVESGTSATPPSAAPTAPPPTTPATASPAASTVTPPVTPATAPPVTPPVTPATAPPVTPA